MTPAQRSRSPAWKHGLRLAPLLALFCPAATFAGDFDPASVDLAALIECRADAPGYNGFALWLAGEPCATGTLGWKEIPSENPFLRQYRLPVPLHVFGLETTAIVFTATGPMAVLDGVAAPELARKLAIPATISTPDKFLGERVVIDETEVADGVTFATRIALNVSTVDSHPGKVLAGCSYAIDVK